MPEGSIGFVYKLHLKDGFSYIGKKSLEFKYRKQPSKKSGKKRVTIVRTQSDWLEYEGSSYRLETDLKSGAQVLEKKQILYFCQSKTDLNYLQVKEQFVQNCLQDKKSYVDNINGKWFSKVEKIKLQ